MKVDIRNLGVLSSAQIELKPLTLFVGPNNSGKTWAAYTLCSIFSSNGWSHYKKLYFSDEFAEKYPPLAKLVTTVLNEGNAKLDLANFTNQYGESYIKDVGSMAVNWMPDYMRTNRARFESLNIDIKLGQTKKHIINNVIQREFSSQLSTGRETREPLLKIAKEKDDRFVYWYTTGPLEGKLPSKLVNEFLIAGAFQVLHRSVYNDIYILPTERTTFVTFPLFQPVTKTALATKDEEKDPRVVLPLIKPVEIFLSWFAASRANTAAREKDAQLRPLVRQYIEMAAFLEREILGGGVEVPNKSPESGRELVYTPADSGVHLEMRIASSMVKELSALVIYLRNFAEPNDLLVIDEPEMNLHPEAQVRLTEFLSMLVNYGLNVLVTTHSPYIVDHLVNLIKASNTESKEKIESKFFLKTPDAFITRDKVSISLFDGGKSKNILKKDGMIDWGTFGKVSDRISQLFYEI